MSKSTRKVMNKFLMTSWSNLNKCNYALVYEHFTSKNIPIQPTLAKIRRNVFLCIVSAGAIIGYMLLVNRPQDIHKMLHRATIILR